MNETIDQEKTPFLVKKNPELVTPREESKIAYPNDWSANKDQGPVCCI